jgi:microcystin-dependent protein
MADQFVAEIRIFPFYFAPTGWAMCNGQILPISQNTALFSLLGTMYGGDGKSNFALPNLQGAAALNAGWGPGLSGYTLGQSGGSENVTLLVSEMPSHTHTVAGKTGAGNAADPTDMVWANPAGRPVPDSFVNGNSSQVVMSASALSVAGGSQPHNNMMPYLALNFCIALQGIYPQRP